MSKIRNNGFSFFDMFAGIGGFHQALKRLGGRCVGACEIDDKARNTYLANHNLPSAHFYKDIHDLSTKNIPDHDLLCAGFPCQPFSISGKKKAFQDKRSSVVDALFEFIRIKKPPMVMLENVKHIKHVNGGMVFEYIIQRLKENGYNVSYKLLNSRDFGVAQNRKRWIFVGVLSEARYKFKLKEKSQTILSDVIEKKGQFDYLDEPFTLITSPKKQPSGLIFCGYRNKKIRKVGVRQGTEHLSRVHKQPNRIYSIDGVHPTIPSQESSGRFWILLKNGKVRKLTVKECFRLMGFDDNFVKPGTDGTLYVQIGNSICVPMVEAVSRSLLEHMGYLNVP